MRGVLCTWEKPVFWGSEKFRCLPQEREKARSLHFQAREAKQGKGGLREQR